MNNSKPRWKVAEKATGPYASFIDRHWPSLETEDGEMLFQIICKNSYSARIARTGEHSPLELYVRRGNEVHRRKEHGRWNWIPIREVAPDSRVRIRKFKTLADVKVFVKEFMHNNPSHDFGLGD